MAGLGDEVPGIGGSGSAWAASVRGAWDVLVLDGTPLPGKATVHARAGRKIDVRESPAANGSGLSYLGYQPASIDVTLVLWTDEQLDQFAKWLPAVQPRASQGAPRAVSVYHPALQLLGIESVFVQEIGAPELDDDGRATVQMRFIERRPLGTKNAEVKQVEPRSRESVFPVTPDVVVPVEIERQQSIEGGISEP